MRAQKLPKVVPRASCNFFFHFDAETKELEQDLLKFLQQKGKTPYAWQEALLSTAAVS